MSDVWPCPSCRGSGVASCGVCEGTGRVVVCSPTKHEALMAAAYWLLKLRSRGYVSAGHGRAIADQALSIIRATGVEIKADNARDERMREIGLRAARIDIKE